MQVYSLSAQFLPKEWIMEKWEDGFYITAMAGSCSGSSLVVMSKGTPYTQQSYKVGVWLWHAVTSCLGVCRAVSRACLSLVVGADEVNQPPTVQVCMR